MTERVYHLPPPGAMSEGLESFAVEAAAGAQLGRIAAVNRGSDGPVVLVESPTGEIRPVSSRALREIDLGRRVVRLAEGTELGHPVETEASHAVASELVRHVPASLERFLVETETTRESPSPLWAVALVLVLLAGFSILPANVLVERDVGGSLRWAWMALPLAILALAGVMMSRAADAEGASGMSFWEKLGMLPAFLLGSSPIRRDRR
jgi:hypothetical protein